MPEENKRFRINYTLTVTVNGKRVSSSDELTVKGASEILACACLKQELLVMAIRQSPVVEINSCVEVD